MRPETSQPGTSPYDSGGAPGPVPPPPRPPRQTGRLLVVAVVVVVIAAAALASALILNNRHTDTFPVGSCVTRDDGKAVAASCDKPGAYKITKATSSRAKCPDPTAPAIELQGAEGDRYRCLSPVK